MTMSPFIPACPVHSQWVGEISYSSSRPKRRKTQFMVQSSSIAHVVTIFIGHCPVNSSREQIGEETRGGRPW